MRYQSSWLTPSWRCCRKCLQLHGGYGIVDEYPIARMQANVWIGPIYGGSNEIMKEIIARSMFAPS
jgi:acyl-CoA dehydrogenase